MDDDEKKLAIVLQCMELDNPRSPPDYIDSLMAWGLDELLAYHARRKSQLAALPKSPFRPHP